jgi:lipid-binding SYLF domain-containing protein
MADARKAAAAHSEAVLHCCPQRSFMKRNYFLAFVAATALTLGACTTTSSSTGPDAASARTEIDTGAAAALSKLYAEVQGSKEMVSKAKGVLVIPRVVSAGLIVGGSRGQGELLIDGRPSGYYSATGASVGVVVGAQSKDVFVLFMTNEALTRFQASRGWTAGVDGSVALVKVGASGSVDTETARHEVIGFVLSNGGLMADLSFEGTKVSKLDL